MHFIASRFYQRNSNTKRGATRPAIRVATIGIAIGLTIMILSTSVLMGFKQQLTQKVTGFAAHIEVLNTGTLQLPDAYPISLPPYMEQKISNIEGISHLQKVSQKMGVLKTGTHFKPILLKGIDENYDTLFISQSLVEGRLPVFRKDSITNEIVISRKIADDLSLKVGQLIYSYFFEDNIKTRRMKIVGIYETSLKQFDESLVITDRYCVCKLNGWSNEQYSEIELKATSFDALPTLKSEVESATAGFHTLTTLTVEEHYPQVFSWLNILNTNVWVILALMAGVAVFTISSGLLVIMLERTPSIGVMQAMGATDGQLRAIFIRLAMLITLKGVAWGNGIALTLLLLQKHFHLLQLNPAHYYVSEVHVVIDLIVILLINAATILIILASLFTPTLILTNISPTKAIKFD